MDVLAIYFSYKNIRITIAGITQFSQLIILF